MIYLSYILANLAILRRAAARLLRRSARCRSRSARWGMLVNVLALVWGGAMMINFLWHRVATNPKPNETAGVLDFNVDFLNKIPILWSVLGVGADPRRAIYYGGAQLEDPVAACARADEAEAAVG